MKIPLSTFAFLVIAVCAACSPSGRTQNTKPITKPAEVQVARTVNDQDTTLQKQLEEIAAAAKGRVGVAALVLEAGKSVSVDPSGHYPMQSVYKLPIGMAVMQQVDAGKLNLDQKVRITQEDLVGRAAHSPIRDRHPNGVELSISDLMGWMLKESDGTASDVLMKQAGGPEAIQAYLTDLKITDMIVLDTEKSFSENHSLQFRNWASPEAAVALLRALHERRGLSERSQALLIKLMTESTPGQKRLKGHLPPGAQVAHKTGTSGTENGVTAATNDAGIITLPNGQHLAIAVFVADSPADQKTREEVIARIAKAVWDNVTGSR
jgi:beta-lactamase class A